MTFPTDSERTVVLWWGPAAPGERLPRGVLVVEGGGLLPPGLVHVGFIADSRALAALVAHATGQRRVQVLDRGGRGAERG
ncbi:hypothetical protein ABT255_01900 [Streptomyces mirabilis]|uniref:hypothetical protein n=1 Tax=Streptomyces mirabilis TaxID=68239 RepID=UPI003331EBD3